MPNSQNRSNGKSGIVQPKRRATKASGQHSDAEKSDMKQENLAKSKRVRSSDQQERDTIRGGSPND